MHGASRLKTAALLGSTVCSLALLAGPAFGQSAAPPGTSSVTPNSVPNVKTPPVPATQGKTSSPDDGADIIVTALKRSQSLTSVPASISALDSTALQARGVATLNDIQLQTPSLSFGTALGTAQVSIRGVGLTIATGAGEPGVAVHLDGVYESRPALSSLAQFDLDRVEILRGPQGTLYGRNATGGAINFISKPATSTFEGGFKVGYAEYNEFHAEMIASGPVSDDVRARFGVTYTKRSDGFLKNISPGQADADAIENIGARGKISIDLSAAATLDLQLTYLHASGSPIYLTPSRPLDPNVVALNPALQGALSTDTPGKTAAQSSILDRTAYSPVATLKWNLGGGVKLTSITGYMNIRSNAITDADGTSAQMGILPNEYYSRQLTQEFNLSGSSKRFEWILGAYYLHEKYKAFQDVLYPNGFTLPLSIPGVGIIPIPVFAAGDQTYQHWTENRHAYAAFGDATLHITDRLSVFAGGRYSRDELVLDQQLATLPAPLTCDQSSKVRFSAFTPRGGVQFVPNHGGNLYASVSRGYKSGGLNFGNCDDPYSPEKVTSYEVGYKTRLFSNHVTLGVAGYYYDYRNLQVYQLKPIDQGGGSFIDNAPKATIKGVEGEASWSPNRSFQFNASGAYLDAKYDEYTNTDSAIVGSLPQNLAGHRIPKSPTFTGNIGAQYTTPDIDNVGHLTLRGETYHSARQSYTEFSKPQDIQKAYTIFNAYLTLESVNQKYSVRLYARNLTDVRYFNFVTNSPLSGTTLVTYAPPRQIGAELSAKF